MRVFTYAHVSIITYRVDIHYRVDVYRSRPIGASLLTTSPQQGCLALNGLHTGAGWACCWLGVVTGISALSAASTGGVLVFLRRKNLQSLCAVAI